VRLDDRALAVGLAAALVAAVGVIGADSRWVSALGGAIVSSGGIPDGVPFASAPSDGWPNVPVLAELILHGLDSAFGDRGLLLANVLAVAAGFTLLALDMRRAGADAAGSAVVLVVVAVGAVATLVVVRLQLFSVALFPALLLLLRSEAARPSRRIWLLVPLVALWSNLHGAVLAGLAVAGAYLVLDRLRRDPLTALGVLAASVLALCLTPALERTPDYYRGVLENEAAQRGFGLWARLSLTSPTDLLLIAAAAVLLVLAARSRPRLWEIVALAALAVLTVRTARTGGWLLFTAATPAACGLTLRAAVRPRVGWALLGAAAVVAVAGIARGPLATGASDRLLDEAFARADGTPVLAEPTLAEQVVGAGGRVWISNPLDAFDRSDQRLYLDWLEGEPAGDAALAHAPRVVLVRRDGDAEERMRTRRDWREASRDDHAALYVRRHS
jgi:hypothetical protein